MTMKRLACTLGDILGGVCAFALGALAVGLLFPSPPRTSRPGAPSIPSTAVRTRGGPVLHHATVYLIFWTGGRCLEPARDATCPGDEGYMQLMLRFARDLGGTPLYGILGQYGDNAGSVTNDVRLGGAVRATNPYPHRGTTSDPLRDDDIRREIDAVHAAERWPTGLHTLYLVFVADGVQVCMSARSCTFFSGRAGWCAYHDAFTDTTTLLWGVQSRTPVVYATLPVVAGIAGCPRIYGAHHDEYGDSELTVVWHELAEAVTDPLATGWANAEGEEIGDKCQDAYGLEGDNGANVVLHGHPYTVQAVWSDAAGGCALPTNPSLATPRPANVDAADDAEGPTR